MKILFASLALATIAVPGAAFAAEGEMEKCCCCDKMKHDGKDCCEEKGAPAPDGHEAGHGDHNPTPPVD